MFSIQNMTNSTIKFQGITISAYMTVTVPYINDYVTLTRLSNSGKVRYFTTPEKKKVVSTPVETSVKTKPVEVKKVEEVKEDAKIEEKKAEELTVEKTDSVEPEVVVEAVEQTVEAGTEWKPIRKNKRNGNKK